MKYPYIKPVQTVSLLLLLLSFSVQGQNASVEGASADLKQSKKLRCYFAVSRSLIPVDASLGYSMVPTAGWNLRAGVYLKDNVRLLGEFTRLDYSLSPWPGSVLFDCYEMNAHFIAHQNDLNVDFYLVSGLAAQNWLGNNVSYKNEFGDVSKLSYLNDWRPGLNFGLGFEKRMDHFSVFGEFKIRMSEKGELATENMLDVVYNLGMSYELPLKWELAKGGELKKGNFLRRGKLHSLRKKANKKGGGNMPPNIYNLDLIQKN
jgi:hypothetical protein